MSQCSAWTNAMVYLIYDIITAHNRILFVVLTNQKYMNLQQTVIDFRLFFLIFRQIKVKKCRLVVKKIYDVRRVSISQDVSSTISLYSITIQLHINRSWFLLCCMHFIWTFIAPVHNVQCFCHDKLFIILFIFYYLCGVINVVQNLLQTLPLEMYYWLNLHQFSCFYVTQQCNVLIQPVNSFSSFHVKKV